MKSLLDSYRANADAARAEASSSTLPNVRERAARAAARWEDMAKILERAEAARRARAALIETGTIRTEAVKEDDHDD